MTSETFSKQVCRASMFALAIGMVCLTLASVASAQLSDKKTVVTVNAPFEVAGSTPQVLPAGTYLFKVVDSKVNRNIVQISNKEEDHVYSLVLAIPIHREEATSKTVMTFKERAAGEPQAIRTWFYPHETWGQEFVYPKEEARIQEADNHDASEFRQIEVATLFEPLTVPELTEAAPPPAAPEEAPAAVTEQAALQTLPEGAVPPAEEPATQIAALPRTAGDVPFLAFIGLLSLGTGLWIRKLTNL